MTLSTDRLELVLLTPHQLELWVSQPAALEKELDCSYQAEPMEGFFLEIVSGQMEITKQDPEHTLWHSFFFLIRKTDRAVIGSADFKAPPNENGEVEIGYGLGKAFEHQGYMTEAVRALCELARKQPAVSCVTAETDWEGFASQRILKRCGFLLYREGETLWWRL